MQTEAHAIGQLDALQQFGFQKEALLNTLKAVANPRLLGTIAGAGLGAAAADEGEGMQGALIGAAGGYGLGAGAAHVGNAVASGAKTVGNAVAPHFNAGVDAAKNLVGMGAKTSPVQQLVNQESGFTAAQNVSRKNWQQDVGQHLDAELAKARASGAGPMPTHQMSLPGMPAPVPVQQPLPLGMPARPPTGAAPVQGTLPLGNEQLGLFGKHADVGFGVGIPKTPFSLSLGRKEERLPGMTKWVPRDVIERAYENTDAGYDPQAVMDAEAAHGELLNPAIGAGVGAAAAKFGLPRGGALGTALGALAGAGGASLVHKLTEGRRRGNAAQALRGIATERDFPLRSQEATTANESSPMAVSRGGDDS